MILLIYVIEAMIIGGLIGLIVLAVNWTRKTVLKSIRSKTVGLLSVYDDLLEEKSQELQLIQQEANVQKKQLLQEIAAQKEQGSVAQQNAAPAYPAGTIQLTHQAVHRQKDMSQVYFTIRDSFSFGLDQVIDEWANQTVAEKGPATRLYEALEFDTVYLLSTLAREEQLAIMRETIPAEASALLDAYLQTHRDFYAIDFYEYLKDRAQQEPRPVVIRVPLYMMKEKQTIRGVEIFPDDEICEGYQVEANHVIYDYSIRKRELE